MKYTEVTPTTARDVTEPKLFTATESGKPGERIKLKVGAPTLRPLYDRILVRRVPQKDRSAGGIIIPDTAKEKPIEGYVVAVGAGAVLDSGVRREMAVRPGMTVMFDKHRGVEIQLGGEEHLVIRELDVIGVCE